MQLVRRTHRTALLSGAHWRGLSTVVRRATPAMPHLACGGARPDLRLDCAPRYTVAVPPRAVGGLRRMTEGGLAVPLKK